MSVRPVIASRCAWFFSRGRTTTWTSDSSTKGTPLRTTTETLASTLGCPETKRMIDFATRWMPYGGGPAEDILVGFGISPTEYFTRLAAVLREPDTESTLDRDTMSALLEVCRRRLWLGE